MSMFAMACINCLVLCYTTIGTINHYVSILHDWLCNKDVSWYLNSLAPGRCKCYLKFKIFETQMKVRYLEHFLWNCPHVNATRPHWWVVNIGAGNGLVPSGITWANVDSDLCCQMPSQGHKELTQHRRQWLSNSFVTKLQFSNKLVLSNGTWL